MRASISESSYGIHLLPSHEVLSSRFRTLRLGTNIHTGFAWLGHGALVKRARVAEFLSLMQHLNASESEWKMADNYFTILSNTFPEVWFDQGIELGGGQPFTVGIEGDERNRRHMHRAMEYLRQIVHEPNLPYISFAKPDPSLLAISRAPCRGISCLLETSIQLAPDLVTSDPELVTANLSARIDKLGDVQHTFVRFPPSLAVDGRLETAFSSPHEAKRGDYLVLDMLQNLPDAWNKVKLVFGSIRPPNPFLATQNSLYS